MRARVCVEGLELPYWSAVDASHEHSVRDCAGVQLHDLAVLYHLVNRQHHELQVVDDHAAVQLGSVRGRKQQEKGNDEINRTGTMNKRAPLFTAEASRWSRISYLARSQ